MDDFDKAIQLGYDAPHAYSSRGMFHAAMGKFDEAISDYTTALEKNSDNEDVSPYITRGGLRDASRIQKGDRRLQRSLSEQAGRADVYQQRAVALKLDGQLGCGD
ncbi:MAG: tetratricopeptide repeat protein [Pirellulaceae bacterium]